MHVDCHETTDSDSAEFTPAKQARDGLLVTWAAALQLTISQLASFCLQPLTARPSPLSPLPVPPYQPVVDVIPDGFFLVAGDLYEGYGTDGTSSVLCSWHRAIIDAVRRVTHIAPAVYAPASNPRRSPSVDAATPSPLCSLHHLLLLHQPCL